MSKPSCSKMATILLQMIFSSIFPRTLVRDIVQRTNLKFTCYSLFNFVIRFSFVIRTNDIFVFSVFWLYHRLIGCENQQIQDQNVMFYPNLVHPRMFSDRTSLVHLNTSIVRNKRFCYSIKRKVPNLSLFLFFFFPRNNQTFLFCHNSYSIA